ncbi:MAG: DegV family protein [Ruminococcus sp.]|nr:DegV family protein [Ruminococcus sp.]
MPKIKIMTDSASDLSVENEKKYDIMVVPFKLAMGEKSYTSRQDFDNEEFYKMMDEYDGIPSTSQITAFEYLEIFKDLYYSDYTDVINVNINSKGSSTHSNAIMAAEQFFEEIPEARDEFRIYNIDGRSYTGAYGYPVVEAAKKAEKGASAGEIVSFIKDWVDNCVIFFGMYSLQYAKKSGRIPAAAAFVGEIMGLRPVSRIQHNQITTEAKVRGDKALLPKIMELTLNEMIPHTPYCIVYGNDSEVRDELAQMMTKAVGYPPADFYQIGSEVAVNAGPKVAGVIFKSLNK